MGIFISHYKDPYKPTSIFFWNPTDNLPFKAQAKKGKEGKDGDEDGEDKETVWITGEALEICPTFYIVLPPGALSQIFSCMAYVLSFIPLNCLNIMHTHI